MVIPFFLTEMPYQRDPEIGNQESDYVDKEQLDTISGARRFSMYKCQLPAEKLDELDSIQVWFFRQIHGVQVLPEIEWLYWKAFDEVCWGENLFFYL